MPTPKKPQPKATQGINVPPVNTTAPADNERAAVIANLIKSGMSYDDAVAAVGQTSKPKIPDNYGADEVIDPDSIPDPKEELETVVVSHEVQKGPNMIDDLYDLRSQLSKARDRKIFQVTINLDQRIFDWLVYATIVEAQMRGRPELTIEGFLNIKLKELKAADPSAGGRRDPRSSGPRDQYNPQNNTWS